MFVVDASVWVARFVESDRFHAASLAWIIDSVGSVRPIHAPLILLPEVAGPIARVTGRQNGIADAIRAIVDAPGVFLSPLDDHLAGASWRLAAELGLKGADAVYVALAQNLGFPLVTWDREQLERAPDVISVRTPTELLEVSA